MHQQIDMGSVLLQIYRHRLCLKVDICFTFLLDHQWLKIDDNKNNKHKEIYAKYMEHARLVFVSR